MKARITNVVKEGNGIRVFYTILNSPIGVIEENLIFPIETTKAEVINTITKRLNDIKQADLLFAKVSAALSGLEIEVK
jgi:hypothetical protein